MLRKNSRSLLLRPEEQGEYQQSDQHDQPAQQCEPTGHRDRRQWERSDFAVIAARGHGRIDALTPIKRSDEEIAGHAAGYFGPPYNRTAGLCPLERAAA